VGYVGREVDSIVRDLTDTAVKMVREAEMDRVRHRARESAERKVMEALTRRAAAAGPGAGPPWNMDQRAMKAALRRGDLDGEELEMELQVAPVGVEIMAPPGMEEMTSQLQSMFQSLGNQRTRARKLKVKDAMRILTEEAGASMLDQEELKSQALEAVEQNGIVFIDEIDKVCRRAEAMGADVSREGVQRDLLPLVEGCAVTTKHGVVRTDHILFIASGAFQSVKPSDLIPELQGRFPILLGHHATDADLAGGNHGNVDARIRQGAEHAASGAGGAGHSRPHGADPGNGSPRNQLRARPLLE